MKVVVRTSGEGKRQLAHTGFVKVNERCRSVHNIRIERLWVEVGRIIVAKWKPFFQALEANHGLRVDSATHMWLLHHLFLQSLNGDIVQWAEDWNAHVMRLKGEKDRAPRDMFMMGLRRRLCGDNIRRQEGAAQDVEGLGIDWEGADDDALVRQLQEQAENPFDNYAPDTLNDVPCEPPECPMTPDQVEGLDSMLEREFNVGNFDMDVYTDVWIRALMWCRDVF